LAVITGTALRLAYFGDLFAFRLGERFINQ